MSNLWLKIKIWFKVALVGAVFLYIILFTANNASKPVQFWYWFRREPETNLLYLVLCSFLAGVVATLLVRTTFLTMRQISDLKERSRAQRIDRQIADIHTKAAMLQTKPPATTGPEENPDIESKT